VVRGNRVEAKPLAPARRGDAIRVWWSNGVVLADNEVVGSRDIVLWYSKDLVVRGNRVADGRYGLHFMYCDDAVIEGNLLTGNSVGAYLMYSRRLRLAGNAMVGNRGPSGYGLGLKEMDDLAVAGNLFAGNRVGIFLDNAPLAYGSTATLEANVLAGNDVGMELLPNVRRAAFTGNAFLENGEQVRLASGEPGGNRWAGNHWSDYAGFDADGDGFGDVPYRAEKLFESLADRRPDLRLFEGGPVARALDLAARAFPLVRPRAKLADERPRMRPHRLASLPVMPAGEGRGLAGAAGGLLAGSVLLLAFPAALRRSALARADRPAAAPVAGPAPLIEARDLTVRFGGHLVLDRVGFAIRAGESVALWGANGAGKTTVLRALLGLVPCQGHLAFAGLDPRRRAKEVRRRVGFVPQEMALPAELAVEEALGFFARLRGVEGARAASLLASLELSSHAGKRVGHLSGGLKQRLALAVALLADPPVLLLDEPTANLDAAARAAFLDLLSALRAAGKTLVFSSHRPEEVAALADRVLHLRSGSVVADSTPETAEVELQIAVAARDLERAAVHLENLGWEPRRLAGRLTVRVPAGRKAEPLARLAAAGVEVQDFSLPFETSSESGHARSA
jgi:nitrous oxidase accessory protein